MKQSSVFLLMFVILLIYPFHTFSADQQKNKKKDNNTNSNTNTVQTIIPIKIELKKIGTSLFVVLNRAPEKLELYTFKTRLHSFMGQGKTRFNITPLLPRTIKNQITVHVSLEEEP